MAIEIREASAQDTEALVELGMIVQQLHVDWRPDIFRTPATDDVRRRCSECLGQKGFRAFVAVDEGRIAGLIALRWMERAGHSLMHPQRFLDIESICVGPEDRGKGIGRALLEKARQCAREHGFPRIELTVWAENVDAQRAFTAWGFRKQTERMALEL